MTQAPVRVVHVPGDHAYVRHLQPVVHREARFTTLPDPTPPARPGSWHPSVVLERSWPTVHAGTFDVIHLHFGYEHLSPDEVHAWAQAVHDARAALVVTIHDVDNPHLADQTGHHENLGAALAAADRIITLTPGAAALVRQRWDCDAVVIGHPHLLPLELVGTRATPRKTERPRIGVPLGSLRANIDAAAVLGWLAGWPGATPTVRVARPLFDAPAGATSDATPGAASAGADRGRAAIRAALLAGMANGSWVTDVVEPGVPDELIWQWLSSLDAVVLPYRWGTHSGWVEACADVGTSVIAPELGFWDEQRPVLTVPRWGAAGAADAAAVLQRLRDPDDPAGGGLAALTRAEREQERTEIHRLHAEVYRSALAGVHRDTRLLQ